LLSLGLPLPRTTEHDFPLFFAYTTLQKQAKLLIYTPYCRFFLSIYAIPLMFFVSLHLKYITYNIIVE
ncbi:MAG: hypothetical protein IJT19_09605, partial [Bacteroidaceae bacterium]|nr:hypothetical protein [Bacteroidaceae bacterium]